ncbi:hypothetical protein LSTR_LSTR004508 [Laodelphax striatellus]|uniref:CST complex subunit Stn1 N-terminal domain-containing protein n=1 Tax=Laodelphax striatellus TaxID=195883 RepID=A0A482XGG3_LAOST|nr:hypothetical protein LSTR_LSTR004508 [Laodelphax striatellus]
MAAESDGLFLEDDVGSRNSKRVFSLWICDVHTMMHCQQLNKYYFHGWHVPYVRVFGTVLSTVPFASSNTYRYEVDDGTGIITCIYNHDWQLDSVSNCVIDKVISEMEVAERTPRQKPGNPNESTNRNDCAKNRCLEWFSRQIRKKGARVRSEVNQGDCVCFTGTVRLYSGQREIRVTQFNRISRLEDEIGLILQYVDLYKSYMERAGRDMDSLNRV